LINRNIHQTIENELNARGIVMDKQNPDVVISYHTYTEKRQQQYGGAYGYGYAPYFMPFGFYRYGWGIPYMPYGNGYGPGGMKTYTQGTLIIDIADAKTNELVWRGTVSGNVDNLKVLEKQIYKGVKAILKKYPVTPGSGQPLMEHHKAIS
jgi:hypothetical protein